ncbi:NAD(P)/FAD-dependent oxidoreductase [Hymenobacter busanensis]|uniref:NAD(P)/FAD-dependent oxidoreductase n=1 Tax=Hymenobacter busanensis TaxID=2607656 RepID=A0A7L4ZUM7_9BACT|nr:FAD-dependent oxidoreductase [Hymenobacter busanensis]KAA9339602.1 NAD(P)/FAD-dependent oxidoreductase [Hymenobacter busanensis]QHJ06643.1 FAD-dependent oxidoreductase [Hymenobacter busanensis]
MHLVIIGNGITGLTCAQTVRHLRPEARITLVSDESAHHYARTALMYVYMGHLRLQDIKPYEDWYWPENCLELVQATASSLDTARREVHLGTGAVLTYDKLLLATGSVGRVVDWPGQELRGVQGLYGLPDLASMERDTRHIRQAVVVGGGLIGIELAEMLRSRGIAVTLLVRDAHYWGSVLPPEEARLVNRQLELHQVDVRYATELREILGDAEGRVRGVVTGTGEEIACEWVGLATGVRPNATLAAAAGIETDRGILVDELLQTSAPEVYAAGDCAQHRQPGVGEVPIEQLWYTGRMQGETVAHTLSGQPTAYRRGVWFNSAKFFDLEYQTYGRVPAAPEPGLESFYWESFVGAQAVRIAFDAAPPYAVRGFNSMGVRLRHDTCAAWLSAQTPVREVVEQLGAANFDPEFFPQYEEQFVAAFRERFPDVGVGPLRRRKGLLSRLLAR